MNEVTTHGQAIPVDRYFDLKIFTEERRDDNQMSIGRVMDINDFDDVWGFPAEPRVDPQEKEDPSWLSFIRSVMNRNKKSIVILRECECSYEKKKHRHHPDYTRPLEVELLCPSCHRKAHVGHKRRDFINVLSQENQQATA